LLDVSTLLAFLSLSFLFFFLLFFLTTSSLFFSLMDCPSFQQPLVLARPLANLL